MLSSQLHPGLVWRTAIHHSLILLIILYFINGAQVTAQQLQDLSIPVASPQIVYTPFVCNASTVLADPQPCAGAWQLSNSTRSIYTIGPSSASGNIIPQMFFEFQASTLYLTTVPLSNASVNLTISGDGIQDVSAIFDSSSGSVSIVNLPQNKTTLLTLTYIPSAESTLFGIRSLIITVPDDASISSILPTPSLPPFVSLPTFIPTPSSPSTTATTTITVVSDKTMVAQAAGITIGLGLGLTALAVLAFYYWKRRRQRLADARFETKSEWSRDG